MVDTKGGNQNKRGRPKIDNPKNCPIKIMLDQDTFDKIAREASAKGISIAEVFRRSYEAVSRVTTNEDIL